MAWRIEESVRRGEIDARERGVVRGRLWLHGLNEPVVLELWGNACPDLAGCVLEFDNPAKTVPLRSDARFFPVQHGVPGDMTVSRKMQVQAARPESDFKARTRSSQVMANGVFLEWFSEANGRVVIEGAGFKTALSLPAWRLTSAEEFERQRESADAFSMFMNRLNQAVEEARHCPPEDRKWNEFDYERMMREGDARREKYMELVDKYHDHPDQERLIARLMGWRIKNPAEGGSYADSCQLQSEGEEESADCFEAETCGEPDQATEGVDWVRENGIVNHPLAMRSIKMGLLLWQSCQTMGIELSKDDDLSRLVNEHRMMGAKLSCALAELAYGRDKSDPPFVVARLKRVLPHLHTAQATLERIAPRHLLPDSIFQFIRAELFAIRESVLRLMTEFRRA